MSALILSTVLSVLSVHSSVIGKQVKNQYICKIIPIMKMNIYFLGIEMDE